MPQPISFMVTPYRKKKTDANSPASPEIDCHVLWKKALLPVIEELGLALARINLSDLVTLRPGQRANVIGNFERHRIGVGFVEFHEDRSAPSQMLLYCTGPADGLVATKKHHPIKALDDSFDLPGACALMFAEMRSFHTGTGKDFAASRCIATGFGIRYAPETTYIYECSLPDLAQDAFLQTQDPSSAYEPYGLVAVDATTGVVASRCDVDG